MKKNGFLLRTMMTGLAIGLFFGACAGGPAKTEQQSANTGQQSRTTTIIWTPDVLLEQGIDAFNNGDYDLAIERYTEAIRMAGEFGDNNYAVAYVNRGNAYAMKDDYNRAIAEYTEAIKLDPYYYLAYFNRGIAYRDLEDIRRAIDDFTQTIKLEPTFVYAYISRAEMYYTYVISSAEEDLDQAIEDLETALRIDPNHPLAPRARWNLEIIRNEREQL